MKLETPHDRKFTYGVALGGAALATALFLVATQRYGLGVFADSVGYVSRARSLMAGDFADAQTIRQPPGYPAILALAGVLGLEPAHALRPLNALAHGLTVFLGGLWMAARFRSRALAAACVLALAMAPLLLWMDAAALADGVFGLFTIGALCAAGRYFECGGRRPLLLSAGFSALALGTRLAGAPLVPVGCLVALLRPGIPWRRRVADAALFGAVALSLAVPWLLYNQLSAGSMFGARRAGSGEVGAVLVRAAGIVWGWLHESGVYPTLYPPHPSPSAAAWGAAAALAVGAAVAVAALAPRPGGIQGRPAAAVPFAAFAILYLAFIAIVKSRIGYPEYRLFVPALAPLLLSAGWALDGAWARLRAAGRPALAAILPLAVLAWTVTHEVPQIVRLVTDFRGSGTGFYSDRAYESAQVIRLLRSPEFATSVDAPVTLYSNYRDIVYWETGAAAVSLLFPRGDDRGEAARAVADRVAAEAAHGRAAILVWIWLRNAPRNTVLPEDVRGLVRVAAERALPDRSGVMLIATGAAPR